MLRLTPVVKDLLIINVVVFLLSQFLSLDALALHYPQSELFQPLQIASHFFVHAGLTHLFFNMFALVMFGPLLEALWGNKRFLFFYLACAFSAAAMHMGFTWYELHNSQEALAAFIAQPDVSHFDAFFDDVAGGFLQSGWEYVDQLRNALAEGQSGAVKATQQTMEQYIEVKMNVPVVGASGAIYGLLLGFGMYYPEQKLMLIFLPIGIKAKYFIPILMVVELFLGVKQFSWDNIAHFAHLGGAVAGFLIILYWRKFDSRYRIN